MNVKLFVDDPFVLETALPTFTASEPIVIPVAVKDKEFEFNTTLLDGLTLLYAESSKMSVEGVRFVDTEVPS